MPTITIRNLQPDLVERIKTAAAADNVSMEEEVRRLLQRHYSTRADVLREIREFKKTLKDTPPITPEELERWIEEGRGVDLDGV